MMTQIKSLKYLRFWNHTSSRRKVIINSSKKKRYQHTKHKLFHQKVVIIRNELTADLCII